jgi:hypothetical protein
MQRDADRITKLFTRTIRRTVAEANKGNHGSPLAIEADDAEARR